MKKQLLFVLLLSLFAFTFTIRANTLRTAEQIAFSVYQFDEEKLFIIAFNATDKYMLRENTIIKITLLNGELLTLSGNSAAQNSHSRSVNVTGTSPISSITTSTLHVFCFELTSEIKKIIDIGIKKIAVNTLPLIYVYDDDDIKEVVADLKKDLAKLKDESK